MKRSLATRVLVVGGGPVGLVLAISLARQGIDVIVAEVRSRSEAPSAKCNHVSARSMEIFRRFGLASAVRAIGLPADFPNDVAYRTTTTGIELARIPIPGRRDRYTDTSGPDGWWPTPEPPHRVNQIFLEPLLAARAAAMENLRFIDRLQVLDCVQDECGVRATALALETGESVEITCEYAVGCDGAKSLLRKQIGATFTGVDFLGRTQSTFIRAPDLLERLKHAPAWATFSVNPRRCGNVYAIDGTERWLVHNYLLRDEENFDAVDRDTALRQILGVGPDFQYQVLAQEDWIARRLIADRFRDRRIFICGDAAHIWVPMAGYGMNAGVADAENLAWLLSAFLSGWASAAILDAYQAERKPITEQASRFAMEHALALQQQREAVPDCIEDEGSVGDALRAAIGQRLYALNVQQYCCAGLNFGYFYADSPIVAYDGEPAPAYTMASFTPASIPGCRTPHLWLEDGRSLYDVTDSMAYSLLRFDPAVDAHPLFAAACLRGVPLRLVDVAAADAKSLYRHALVISRPDQHVAWRGNTAPADPLALIDLLRGVHKAPACLAATSMTTTALHDS
jgi:2-polyprenyl-6-methoxyphenol hydroxylase-like FAD-dependent oxidoreductase